jgi:histone-lysine N-methyltransferase MLL3
MAKDVPTDEKDRRHCVLCSHSGDGDTNGTARLLNVDLDAWVHLNCALWSHEVYETQNGALMNVGDAIKRGEKTVTILDICIFIYLLFYFCTKMYCCS